MPSSQPTMNTVGNSNPLAECSVIIITLSSPAISSVSDTNDTFSKKSLASGNSSAAPMSSSRFSMRPCASWVSSLRNSAKYPLRSSNSRNTWAGPCTNSPSNSSTSLMNSLMPRNAAPPTPAEAARRKATDNARLCSLASADTLSRLVSPTPRLGELIARRMLISSAGFTTQRKYATASFTSLRS